PPMAEAEALEVAAIHSVSAAGFEAARWGARPYRSPHHSASGAAMVGGGNLPRPGEISLAHCGVLFLDELPEFYRDVLESLREPPAALRGGGGRAAGAARVGPGLDRARGAPVAVPGALPAGRRDEPLPLRPLRLAREPLPLHARAHRALPRPRLGSARRPHRHQ